MIFPLCTEPKIAASGDGNRIAFLRPEVTNAGVASFQLTVLTAKGDTVYSRQMSAPSIPVSAFVRDSISEELRKRPTAIRSLFGSTEVARFYPPVSYLLIEPSGEVWVGLRAAPGATMREWRVMTPAGAPQATLWLPRDAGAFAVEPRGMWTYSEDEEGVQSMVLYSRRPAR